MKTKIWSTRWTAAQGNHFVMERECDESEAQAWIKIFSDDEPNVCFFPSKRKPSNKRNA